MPSFYWMCMAAWENPLENPLDSFYYIFYTSENYKLSLINNLINVWHSLCEEITFN